MGRRAVLFDVDGTLIDSNYLHAQAWRRAFLAAGYDVPTASIHRHIGQGSDLLMSALVGRPNAEVKARWRAEFAALRPEVRPLPGAVALVRELADRGLAIVLATSSEREDVEVVRAVLGVDDVLAGVTDAADVRQPKPDPEVFEVALRKAGARARDAIVIGDTVWDVEAARGAHLDCIGLTTGGISAFELLSAGAVTTYDSLLSLGADLDMGPMARLLRTPD